MSQDYVTRLQLQLREAARREERRGWLARLWAGLMPAAPVVIAVAATVVVGLLVVLVAVPYLNRSEPVQPEPQPRVVGNLEIADSLTSVAPGFGSAWAVAGSGDGRVLRIEPRTGRVQAEIPLDKCGEGLCAAGAPAFAFPVAKDLWAVGPISQLTRIDPRTNRVKARIDLPFNSGGAVVPVAGVLWVIGFDSMVRVDPRSNEIVRTVSLARDGFQLTGAGESGGSLWLSRSNNEIERRDVRTGALEASVPIALQGAGGLYVAQDMAFVGNSAGVLARIDPDTGRSLWQTDIGDRIIWSVLGEDAVFVIGKTADKPRDQLFKLDPRSGRLLSSVELPEFGATTAEMVGGELWVTTANGHILIVRV